MALYSYKAIDSVGKTAKGLQDAGNLIDLEMRLKRSGLDLISAKEEADSIAFGSSKIKRTDLITFFFNLEQLVRAGVPSRAARNSRRRCRNTPTPSTRSPSA